MPSGEYDNCEYGYRCWDLTKKSVSFWKLDDNTTNTDVVDSLYSNNGFASTNTRNISATGKVGRCFDFDGSSVYLSLPREDFINQDYNYSVSLWLNTRDLESGTVWQYAMLSGEYSGLKIGNGGKLIYSSFLGGIPLGKYTTIVANTWYHVVCVYNGGVPYLYVNGVSYDNNLHVVLGTHESYLYVGISRSEVGTISDYFNGYIDQFSTFNYSLSQEEVWDLYNYGNGTEELTGGGRYYLYRDESITVNETKSIELICNDGERASVIVGDNIFFIGQDDDGRFVWDVGEDNEYTFKSTTAEAGEAIRRRSGDQEFVVKWIGIGSQLFDIILYNTSIKRAQIFDINDSFTPTKASLYLRRSGSDAASFFTISDVTPLVIDASNFLNLQQNGYRFIFSDTYSDYTGNGFLEVVKGNSSSRYPIVEYPVRATNSGLFYLSVRGQALMTEYSFDVLIDNTVVSSVSETFALPSTTWRWFNATFVLPDTQTHTLGIRMNKEETTLDQLYISMIENPTLFVDNYSSSLSISPFVTLHANLNEVDNDYNILGRFFVYDYKNSIEDIRGDGWYNFDLQSFGSNVPDFSEKAAIVFSTSGDNMTNHIVWELSTAEDGNPYYLLPSAVKV